MAQSGSTNGGGFNGGIFAKIWPREVPRVQYQLACFPSVELGGQGRGRLPEPGGRQECVERAARQELGVFWLKDIASLQWPCKGYCDLSLPAQGPQETPGTKCVPSEKLEE